MDADGHLGCPRMLHIRQAGNLVVFLLLLALPAAAQLVFEDVSEQAGLREFRYASTTIHSLGINWIDFDNDYDADLFLVNGGRPLLPHLYRNNGDSTFTAVDELLPPLPQNVDLTHSVFADYDNDGDSDIYIFVDNRSFTGVTGLNREDGPANLFLKNLWVENGERILPGKPLFEEIAAQAGVDDLADPPVGNDWPGLRAKTGGWLDYDRDGCIDLFIGHLVFGPRGRGRLSTRNRFYRNNCNGGFEDVTASSGVNDGTDPSRFRPTLAFIGAHLDGDLWPDMFVVNVDTAGGGFHHDVLFRNNADGTFRDATADSPGLGDDAENGMGIDVADIDLDGDWDMYISDILNTKFDQPPLGNPLYLGNGDGTFARNSAPEAGVSAFSSWGVTFFDADQDGYEDLLVATMPGLNTPLVYRNQGDGTFVNLTGASNILTPDGRGTAVDYDGDGDLDVALINEGRPVSLYRNVAPLQGGYLRVRPRARQSNRSAIGTLIKVKAGPYSMMRQIKGGSSAHSQDELVAHFGLRFESVQEVRIYWPSGVEDVIQNLAPNQTITVAEGTTAAAEPYVHAYPRYLDFGVSSPDAATERTLRIMNEGAGELTVTGITSQHSAFSVVAPDVPFGLAPYGGSREVVVRFNGSAGSSQKSDIEIASNDPSSPITKISIEGTTPGPALRDRINPGRSRLRPVAP